MIKYDDVYIKALLGDTPYPTVFEKVQQYISLESSEQIQNMSEVALKGQIEKYIRNYKITRNIDDDISGLVDYIYHDMAGFSFITREKLFDMEGFEELNINAWNDVDIMIGGKMSKTAFSFLSPQQAIDIHQRMLRVTGTPLDDAMPKAVADLNKGIRVAITKAPINDADVAVSSSIRKVSNSIISRETLLNNSSLSEEMLNFLLLCLNHGRSISVSGDTGAGKTALAGYLLSEVAKRKRTITIEQGSREWDFIVRDKNGKPLNSVIHWKTRPNLNDDKLSINQEDLVELILRFDAEITGIGEMRGAEAFAVIEAGNTGNTIISTTHADDTESQPMRLVTLAKKAYAFDDDTLLSMATKAFPILVHMEKLPDDSRRVTEITEVCGYRDHQIIFNRLYNLEIADNIKNLDGSTTVVCQFEKKNNISKQLAQKLLKKGASKADLKPYIGDDIN